MKRRTFIVHSSGTIASLLPTLSPLAAPRPAATIEPQLSEGTESAIKAFSKQDWLTIETVQNHLFPSSAETPGAVEINALDYLYQYLNNPVTDPGDVEFILSGTRLLQQFVTDESANKTLLFTEQSITQREIILRKFEQHSTEARRWLISILNYLLEALLTDPVYGGNPDGIGWQWLEHRAGLPRPPMNKRYWLL